MNFLDPFGLYCTDEDGNRVPCQVSEEGHAFVAGHEGFRSEVYDDGFGFLTIGFGHRVRPGEEFGTLTREEAWELMKSDLAPGLRELDAVDVELSQHQVDALASFIFNVGVGNSQRGWRGSTLRNLVNEGDFAGAAGQFGRWIYSAGRVAPGLLTRRAAEARLFSTGNYGRN